MNSWRSRKTGRNGLFTKLVVSIKNLLKRSQAIPEAVFCLIDKVITEGCTSHSWFYKMEKTVLRVQKVPWSPLWFSAYNVLTQNAMATDNKKDATAKGWYKVVEHLCLPEENSRRKNTWLTFWSPLQGEQRKMILKRAGTQVSTT
jgi:hypothetical protein